MASGGQADPALAQQLRLLEDLPLTRPSGVLRCLCLLAEQSGWGSRELVLALSEAEDAGDLTWNTSTQQVTVTRQAEAAAALP
jgi:hypothetical protein